MLHELAPAATVAPRDRDRGIVPAEIQESDMAPTPRPRVPRAETPCEPETDHRQRLRTHRAHSSPTFPTSPTFPAAKAAAALLATAACLAPPALARPNVATLLAVAAAPAAADEVDENQPDRPRFRDELEVRERGADLVGIALSASEGSVGQGDLEHRPILRAGNLAEAVPGLVATQHSGGGKANQFFVRGFNLDHGTDFAISVAGVPVNLPTHGHGQGYADLNFLIPEVVARARYRKGPYWADVGDFSSAGSLDIDLVSTLPRQVISITGGSNDYGRALFADSFSPDAGGDLLLALEGFHDDGPWTRGDSYEGGRGVVRYSRSFDHSGFSVTAMGYDADWLSTDQVPRRAVESGLIGRFDLIDPGPRGASERFSLSAEGYHSTDRVVDAWSAYAVSSDFSLVSNFTYLLDDPELGDQFLQLDDRSIFGGRYARTWLGSVGSRRVETTVGVQLRHDRIDNGLFRTADLAVTDTVRSDSVEQWGGGPYVETRVELIDLLRLLSGVRLDAIEVDVTSVLAANSGSRDDTLVSPKLSFAFGPWNDTELYLNLGYGMHSNDARGALTRIDPVTGEALVPVDPLVRAEGIDVGVRSTAIEGLQTTLTVFQLELDSELLFVGDAGVTEANRPSRRRGVEWATFYRFTDQVEADVEITLTDAEFTDFDPAGSEIPGAIGRTVTAGFTWDPQPLLVSMRWREFGDIPLIEDGLVEWDSSSTVDARVAYTFELSGGALELGLDVFNLLDSDDSDIQYFYASRLPGEPADGVEDVHFHPLQERSARLTLSWKR